jgi:hypothetical protein
MNVDSFDGEEVLIRFKPLPALHEHDDQADEYIITRNPDASSGIVEYALYHGEWDCNPFTSRPIVRFLLAEIDRLKAELAAKGDERDQIRRTDEPEQLSEQGQG